MIRSFLPLVALAVLPAVAVAQLPAPPYSFAGGTCAGGVCGRIQSAVQEVRSAGADLLHHAGNVVAGPVQPFGQSAVTVPQRMPGPAVTYPVQQTPRQPLRYALRRLYR